MTVPLGSVQLEPRSTKPYDFSKLLGAETSAPDHGSVSLTETFAGNESDLQMVAGSVAQTGNYVFETTSHIEDWTASRMLCYSSVFSDTNTMISLWNNRVAAQDLTLTLSFRGGQYELPIHLAAGADLDLDLDLTTLIKQRVPDVQGAVIPANITEGRAIGGEGSIQAGDVTS